MLLKVYFFLTSCSILIQWLSFAINLYNPTSMKPTLVFLFCFTFFSNLHSQSLSFDEPQTLLEFPDELFGVLRPIFPLDFNEDGITDLMRKKTDDEILVYKGIGNDEYETVDNDFYTWRWIALKSMDFDNDGDQDVVTARYILINEGDGNFSRVDPPSFNGYIIEAADFDGNGYTDILTHSNEDDFLADQELILFYNQGDDTYTSQVLTSGGFYGDVDLGDIDGDGDLDLVALDDEDDFPILILTNEGGSFTAQKTNHALYLNGSNVYLVDMDNDGDLDILTNGVFDNLYMIENNEDLLTDDIFKIFSTSQILYFKHADLNKDGQEDIVYYGGNNSEEHNIFVMEGKEGFDFEESIKIGSYDRLSSSDPNDNYTANNISLYDYDQDGKLDILHTDGFSELNKYEVIKNITINTSTTDVKETDLLIYPNPIIGSVVYIEDKEIDVPYKIFDINGAVIKKGITNRGTINVDQCSSGIYYLSIQGRQQKFVKH